MCNMFNAKLENVNYIIFLIKIIKFLLSLLVIFNYQSIYSYGHTFRYIGKILMYYLNVFKHYSIKGMLIYQIISIT